MKVKWILCFCLGLATLSSSTLGATVQFRGGLCILQATAACVPDETAVGVCYQMRYSPPNLGSNGPSTSLTLIEFGGAHNYRLNNGSLIGTTYQTVAGTGVYRLGFSFSSKMRITDQSPATLTTATSVTITGNIRDFDATPGCHVQFRGAATLR